MIVLFAGVLGAITGRFVSDAFRFGFIGGLLLGVLGYGVAVFALSLGIRVPDAVLFFVCVSAGGIIGGLIPAMLQRWRAASSRRRVVVLLFGLALLVALAVRWRTVSTR